MGNTKGRTFLVTSVFFSLLLFVAPDLWSDEFSDEFREGRVGVASRDITPPVGVPLAGFGGGKRRLWPFDVFGIYPYAAWLKPSDGVRDPIRAKVTWIEDEAGKPVIFVSVDLIGSLPELVKPVVKWTQDLGVTEDNLIVSGTHTHSGPGAITKNVFWSLLAVDKYQRKVAERLVRDIADAVRDAYVARRRARLYHTSFDVMGIQRNRRKKVGHFDSRAHLILARDLSGNWLGGMINLAMHGTSLGTSNLKFSADVLGEIEREMERRLAALNGPGADRVHMGFFNGAEGDVSPNGEMVEIGQRFADHAMAALPGLREIRKEFELGRKTIKLGWPNMNLHGCTEKFLPRFLKGNLWPLFGTRVDIWSVRLDDVYMMSFPGEMNTSLGFMAHQVARDAGFEHSMVLGLVNDHRSYFTDPSEYFEGLYESCASFYGKNGGVKLVEGHRELLEAEASRLGQRK